VIRIIDFITRGTIEEDQVTRLHEKLQRLEEITRDRAALVAAGKNAGYLDLEEQSLLNEQLRLDGQLELSH
jgi:hypothetical protein